ncbi:MAG: hypothetical protein QMC67_09210 [Candidatus Wallbacteria bacterium]
MNNEDFEKTLACYKEETSAGKFDFSQISNELYIRLADKTFGYVITSFVSILVLFYILPAFYKVYDGMYMVKKHLPSFYEALEEMFPGPGGFMLMALMSAFYIGGLGLFHSQRWARIVLIYAFATWGLIILFEYNRYVKSLIYTAMPVLPFILIAGAFILIKWDLARLIKTAAYGFLAFLVFCFWIWSSRENMQTVIRDISMVFLVSSPYIIICGFAYLIYQAQKAAIIRMMSIINCLFTITNIYCVFRVCFETPAKISDHHIVYLSIFFAAVILVQSFICGREFIPYITKKELTRS